MKVCAQEGWGGSAKGGVRGILGDVAARQRWQSPWSPTPLQATCTVVFFLLLLHLQLRYLYFALWPPWSPLPLHSARIAFALESFNLYYEEHKFWWPLTIAYLLTCTANCNFLLLDLQSFAFTWKILHFLSTEVLDLAAFAMMLRPN